MGKVNLSNRSSTVLATGKDCHYNRENLRSLSNHRVCWAKQNWANKTQDSQGWKTLLIKNGKPLWGSLRPSLSFLSGSTLRQCSGLTTGSAERSVLSPVEGLSTGSTPKQSHPPWLLRRGVYPEHCQRVPQMTRPFLPLHLLSDLRKVLVNRILFPLH